MKCEAGQELVVGGFTDPQGSRVGLGALLVGYFDKDDFVFAGKLGTGFDTKLLLELASASRQAGNPHDAVHALDRPAAAARALGEARGRGAGGLHRMDGPRQAAPPEAHRRASRQGGARRRARGTVKITHPEKVLFPDDGITKGELAAYYEAIAPVMLPHILRRPVTMERFPAGIGKPGFLQKDVSKGFPAWLERVEVPKKDGVVHHPIVTDVESLLVAGESEQHHAACVDVAGAGGLLPRHLRFRSRSLH